MREEWRPIPGWEGLYEASRNGEIRSVPRKHSGSQRGKFSVGGIILKPWSGRKRPCVQLWRDNKGQVIPVARLVDQTFGAGTTASAKAKRAAAAPVSIGGVRMLWSHEIRAHA